MKFCKLPNYEMELKQHKVIIYNMYFHVYKSLCFSKTWHVSLYTFLKNYEFLGGFFKEKIFFQQRLKWNKLFEIGYNILRFWFIHERIVLFFYWINYKESLCPKLLF